jgi:2-keto-4-pentenoate hydratase/2-oxohepta-3-ene-1,7-dioic acid hydratase in catechol pathway
MKLVTYRRGGEQAAVGILTGSGVIPTGHDDMLGLIRAGGLPEPAGDPVPDATLLAPVPRPGKLLFCGVNYASHKQENPNAVLPAEPFFFSKLPSAVVGPDQPIRIPAPHSQVDYEVELAVVIGRAGRAITEQAALSHVYGYTVVNDVSGRDVQFKDAQITLGKGFDTFSPMGPCLLTADEVPDPGALTVSSHVNGERRQHEATANMLFTVPALLAFVSQHITLEPGDIVTTGTPAGVGTFHDPPRYLAPGDTVSVEVDAIGRLSNPVTADWV